MSVTRSNHACATKRRSVIMYENKTREDRTCHEEQVQPGILSYVVGFWYALVGAVWLLDPSNPATRNVFAGHMLVLLGYNIIIIVARLLHNRKMWSLAWSGVLQGDRYYRNDVHMTMDKDTGLVRQGYTPIVHGKRDWFSPLFDSVIIVILLWWQGMFSMIFQ